MSVFLDTSKRRKIYFRSAVSIISGTIIFAVAFFVFNIIFGKGVALPPVKYADTVESYHYYYSAANKNKIAITFDDGPRPDITRGLMNILKNEKVTGTFFFIGQEILLEPNIVREVYENGFGVGNHSFTHREDIHSSQNRLALELRSTGYLLSKITGKIPQYYRPPFLLGIGIDPTVNPYIPIPKDVLWSLEDGVIPTGTDIDPEDWLAVSSQDVVDRFEKILKDSPNGHIVLLHEEKHTVEALPKIIALLKDKGYKIVSLEELLTPPKEIALASSLKIGNTDETTNGDVSKLQWFLYQQGDLDPYLLTGIFNTETRNALTAFQLRNNLIDPNNVDPKRAGIADLATRNTIATISLSLVATSIATKTPTLWDKSLAFVGTTAITGYVKFVPFTRSTLIWILRVALFIVMLRCFFIAIVFIIGWHRKKKSYLEPLSREYKKNRGVSVLIPAYNEEENIRSTIESIIHSTYARKEIIVINDGSTDRTAEIVQSVIDANLHMPIKLLSIKNGGKSSALNHGIEVSRFDVCVVIDADAVLEKHALHYFMRHFEDPNVGAVAGRVRTTGRRGFLNLFQTLEYAIGQNIDKRALSTLGAIGVVPGPAGAWNKSFVIAAGGFSNDTLVEDQDMTLTLLRMGKRILYDGRAVAYTETPDTITNFLKQRFRWVYGTMQCFWKNRSVLLEQPTSIMSLVVMPNIFIFNILLPLTYPFADFAFVVGLIWGEWQSIVIPFLMFTLFDLLYAWIGLIGESDTVKLLSGVPLQRVSYRQLLYYTVIKSVVRAIEGSGSAWNKFAKTGETQRFYFSSVKKSSYKKQLGVIDVPSEWLPSMLATSNNLDGSDREISNSA